MNAERIVRIVAGGFIIVSLLLSNQYNDTHLFAQPNWLWFTLFVGVNLFQSGFTRFCPLNTILSKLGVKS